MNNFTLTVMSMDLDRKEDEVTAEFFSQNNQYPLQY